MKLRTRRGKYVDLSPLQIKLVLHCISDNIFFRCARCRYDRLCTEHYYILFNDTPNGVITPKNFATRVTTNNYRKLHNLPKKRKGVDYFD